jgi:hypothetical protein
LQGIRAARVVAANRDFTWSPLESVVVSLEPHAVPSYEPISSLLPCVVAPETALTLEGVMSAADVKDESALP